LVAIAIRRRQRIRCWVIQPQVRPVLPRWVVPGYRSTVATHRHAPSLGSNHCRQSGRCPHFIPYGHPVFGGPAPECGFGPKAVQAPRAMVLRASAASRARDAGPDHAPLAMVRGPFAWVAVIPPFGRVTRGGRHAPDVDACAETPCLARNNARRIDASPRFRQRHRVDLCLGQRIHLSGGSGPLAVCGCW